jgi:exodeoxyribonuclease-3
MKVATWNVNSLKVRLPQVLDWLVAAQPDILCLQETKLTDENFPREDIEAAGFRVAYAGQKTYNGVAILSKGQANDTLTDIPGLDDPQRRILAATIDGVRVLNLYVVNGQEVGSEKYAWKLEWLERVTDYIQEQLKQHPRFVVLGDFNIAPEDRDVHDPEAWHERILCSTPEREALQRITDLGLVDTFRLFQQEDASFSWWDYRAAAFRRNNGLRIDLILASPGLVERCLACRIDKEPRGLERPSDHAPVLAEFDL